MKNGASTHEDGGGAASSLSKTQNVLLQLLLTLIVASIGFTIVIQSAINVELSNVFGNELAAAGTSFFVSSISALPFSIHGPPLEKVKVSFFEKDLAWYSYSGGVLGAIYVLATIYLPPVIGLSLMFVTFVSGTLLTALIFDHFGLLGFATRRLNFVKGILDASKFVRGTLLTVLIFDRFGLLGFATRRLNFVKGILDASKFVRDTLLTALIFDHFGLLGFATRRLNFVKGLGALASLAGVGLVGNFDVDFDYARVLYGVLGLLTGAFTLPLQAVFNRQLGGVVLTPYRATLVSCIIGFIFLAICTAISVFFEDPQFVGVEWWHFVGGILGVIYVGSAIIVPPFIGLTSFFVAFNCGNIFGSLVLDHYGFLSIEEIPISLLRIFGGVAALLGVVLVRYESGKAPDEPTVKEDVTKQLLKSVLDSHDFDSASESKPRMGNADTLAHTNGTPVYASKFYGSLDYGSRNTSQDFVASRLPSESDNLEGIEESPRDSWR